MVSLMEQWRRTWREGISPILSDDALCALANGLRTNDRRLTQGTTTIPPPLPSVQDWPVEEACVLGYCGWQGENLHTVGEVEEFFARLCFEIDQRLGEPSGCGHLLRWWDETPREEVFPLLLSEVERSILLRDREDSCEISDALNGDPEDDNDGDSINIAIVE